MFHVMLVLPLLIGRLIVLIIPLILAGKVQFYVATHKKKWMRWIPLIVGICGVVFSVTGLVKNGEKEFIEFYSGVCFMYWLIYFIVIGISFLAGRQKKNVTKNVTIQDKQEKNVTKRTPQFR